MEVITAVRPHGGRGGGRDDGRVTAGTPSLLRAINERSVLELIHRGGPLSRAQVAHVSGPSQPTVSLAVTGLLAAPPVREGGKARGGRGPSALTFRPDPTPGAVAGIG